jgi:hypothetical protein
VEGDPTFGNRKSGMYWIDPDAQGVGDAPIYINCDMQTGSIGKLIIKIRPTSLLFHFLLIFTSQERHQSALMTPNRRWTSAIASIPDTIPGPSITTPQVIKCQHWLALAIG